MPSELMFSKNRINPTLLHRVCTAGGGHLLLFILENDLILPLTKEYLVKVGIVITQYLYIFSIFIISVFVRWVLRTVMIKQY